MDEYKISQTPGTKKSAPSTKGKKAPKRKGSKAPKARNTKALNPQLVMGAVVVALVLVLAGVAWAHFVAKDDTPTGTTASVKDGGKAGSKGIVPGEAFKTVTNAISDKNPSSLNKYYAKEVKVVIRKKGINQMVSGKSVEALIKDVLNSAQTPWDWHVSTSQLSAWQQGPYGQYFTGNVIVGISNDGTVVSIELNDDGEIITVFIAPVGDLTTPGTPTPAGDTSGGGTTTPTPTTPTPVTNDSAAD